MPMSAAEERRLRRQHRILANSEQRMKLVMGEATSGGSDGGSRVHQDISAYGWILKAWTDKGGPVVLAAGAKFFSTGPLIAASTLKQRAPSIACLSMTLTSASWRTQWRTG